MPPPPNWVRTSGFWMAFIAGLMQLWLYSNTGDNKALMFAAAMFVCMAINNHDFDQKPRAD